MTESQEDALNEIRRKVSRKHVSVLHGYTVEVRVEDLTELLQLVDDLLDAQA